MWINFDYPYLFEVAQFSHRKEPHHQTSYLKTLNLQRLKWMVGNLYIKRGIFWSSRFSCASPNLPFRPFNPKFFGAALHSRSCVTMKHGMSWAAASPRPGYIPWRRSTWWWKVRAFCPPKCPENNQFNFRSMNLMLFFFQGGNQKYTNSSEKIQDFFLPQTCQYLSSKILRRRVGQWFLEPKLPWHWMEANGVECIHGTAEI